MSVFVRPRRASLVGGGGGRLGRARRTGDVGVLASFLLELLLLLPLRVEERDAHVLLHLLEAHLKDGGRRVGRESDAGGACRTELMCVE